jgi:hypothetical protein
MYLFMEPGTDADIYVHSTLTLKTYSYGTSKRPQWIGKSRIVIWCYNIGVFFI